MTFPRERGVATDLADLWTDRRSQARRRSLGLSALDPDDGALEVRDGSGSPVAMVGEYGSVRGLLVPDGAGGWRTVQADAQAKADAALATARTEIAEGAFGDRGQVDRDTARREGRGEVGRGDEQGHEGLLSLGMVSRPARDVAGRLLAWLLDVGWAGAARAAALGFQGGDAGVEVGDQSVCAVADGQDDAGQGI